MKMRQFGPFTLDSNDVLSRGGEVVPVPPKEMQLLRLLVSAGGGTVGHSSIEQALWPRQTITYASITRCVYSLRKVLGDDEHTLIVTMPKRGYRLALPVKTIRSASVESVARKIAQARPRAHADFTEARRMLRAGDFGSLEKAAALFEQAARGDPGFAAAYSALADLRMYQLIRGYVEPGQGLRAGLESSERALKLDNELASAYAARGWFRCMAGDADAGVVDLHRGLQIDPEYARGLSYLSFVQHGLGLAANSLRNARRAVALDPHALLHRNALSWRLFCFDRVEESLEMAHKNRTEYGEEALSHGTFAMIASYLGHDKEALAAEACAQDRTGSNPGLMTLRAYVQARSGDRKKARAMVEQIPRKGLPRAPRSFLAVAYLELGDLDEALALFKEARDERCPWFMHARTDPRIGDLADKPRFQRLYDDSGLL